MPSLYAKIGEETLLITKDLHPAVARKLVKMERGTWHNGDNVLISIRPWMTGFLSNNPSCWIGAPEFDGLYGKNVSEAELERRKMWFVNFVLISTKAITNEGQHGAAHARHICHQVEREALGFWKEAIESRSPLDGVPQFEGEWPDPATDDDWFIAGPDEIREDIETNLWPMDPILDQRNWALAQTDPCQGRYNNQDEIVAALQLAPGFYKTDDPNVTFQVVGKDLVTIIQDSSLFGPVARHAATVAEFELRDKLRLPNFRGTKPWTQEVDSVNPSPDDEVNWESDEIFENPKESEEP